MFELNYGSNAQLWHIRNDHHPAVSLIVHSGAHPPRRCCELRARSRCCCCYAFACCMPRLQLTAESTSCAGQPAIFQVLQCCRAGSTTPCLPEAPVNLEHRGPSAPPRLLSEMHRQHPPMHQCHLQAANLARLHLWCPHRQHRPSHRLLCGSLSPLLFT
jgi:hypothetical protein